MGEKKKKSRLPIGLAMDILGIVIIVFSILFPFHFFLPAWNYQDEILDIEPYGIIQVENNFFMGGIIKGTVLNDANKSLDFYILNSNGEKTFEQTKLGKKFSFEFQPQETSLYKLIIDSTEETNSSIYIIIWEYYYNVLFLCLGFAIFILGIVQIIAT